MIEKVNIAEKLALFDDQWSPKIAGRVNNFEIKLVKLEGEFDWHHHIEEDEMFLIIKGSLIMKLRDKEIEVNEGEFIIIPHGVEHKPYCPQECHIMLIEREGTVNTGNLEVSEFTVTQPDEI